ncbi:hypothetical protein J6590_011368 [Homalodisca vitripennis]|nr:hypothetical protein J6590_011368 [Homalodisca vitripennis]
MNKHEHEKSTITRHTSTDEEYSPEPFCFINTPSQKGALLERKSEGVNKAKVARKRWRRETVAVPGVEIRGVMEYGTLTDACQRFQLTVQKGGISQWETLCRRHLQSRQYTIITCRARQATNHFIHTLAASATASTIAVAVSKEFLADL